MKLKLSVLLLCFIFFACDRNNKQTIKEDSLNIDSATTSLVIMDSAKYAIYNDSLISLYNGLNKIRFHNFFFHLGELKYEEKSYYLWFQNEADMQSPDSIESVTVDPEKYLVEFGRGYHALQISFFKDSSSSVYAFIKFTDANVGYGEDNIMYVLKRDSTNKWIDFTYGAIDKMTILKTFVSEASKKDELTQLFYVNFRPDSNSIILTVNRGRKNLYCEQYPKDIVCRIQESQLDDSLVIKWLPQEHKYKIVE